jgi:hypothetical protein
LVVDRLTINGTTSISKEISVNAPLHCLRGLEVDGSIKTNQIIESPEIFIDQFVGIGTSSNDYKDGALICCTIENGAFYDGAY